jgi:hypothetical protein
VLIGIVVAIVLRLMLKPKARLIALISYPSNRYLRRELSSKGVDVSRLPRACLSELTAKIVEDSKTASFAARQSWRANIVNDIERASLGIAFELSARPSPRGQEGGRESRVGDDYLTIIRKYVVAMPSSEDALQRNLGD